LSYIIIYTQMELTKNSKLDDVLSLFGNSLPSGTLGPYYSNEEILILKNLNPNFKTIYERQEETKMKRDNYYFQNNIGKYIPQKDGVFDPVNQKINNMNNVVPTPQAIDDSIKKQVTGITGKDIVDVAQRIAQPLAQSGLKHIAPSIMNVISALIKRKTKRGGSLRMPGLGSIDGGALRMPGLDYRAGKRGYYDMLKQGAGFVGDVYGKLYGKPVKPYILNHYFNKYGGLDIKSMQKVFKTKKNKGQNKTNNEDYNLSRPLIKYMLTKTGLDTPYYKKIKELIRTNTPSELKGMAGKGFLSRINTVKDFIQNNATIKSMLGSVSEKMPQIMDFAIKNTPKVIEFAREKIQNTDQNGLGLGDFQQAPTKKMGRGIVKKIIVY